MDVIYPYRAAPLDYELRYSLRSLENMPHERVIVAGDRPKLVSDDLICIEVEPQPNRYLSSTSNILAACEASDSEQIVVMHDDIFILEPWTYRHENRGTIAEYLALGQASGGYRAAVEATRDVLAAEGINDPLFFGLHTPVVYDRRRLIDLIRAYQGQPLLLRTLYFNLFPQPSVKVEDVKLHRWPSFQVPAMGGVLSIADDVAETFGFRRWIEQRFPRRSRYEKSGRCLILGYGPSIWADLEANWGEFDAVIASPEAAAHWKGPLLAVASDDDQARRIAASYGFADIVLCGATEEVDA